MRTIIAFIGLVLSFTPTLSMAMTSLYDFNTETLAGAPISLKTYTGKVALVVNVASKCGFTKQYTGLQKLYTELEPRGLVVLGFPANDFAGQEPGTAEEISTFCSTKYQVTFPLFAKLSTKGGQQSPLYQFLSATYGEPKWNFHKYLINKKGAVVAAYPSSVAPEAPELRQAIEAELLK
jgi:glutathione peroxidase